MLTGAVHRRRLNRRPLSPAEVATPATLAPSTKPDAVRLDLDPMAGQLVYHRTHQNNCPEGGSHWVDDSSARTSFCRARLALSIAASSHSRSGVASSGKASRKYP